MDKVIAKNICFDKTASERFKSHLRHPVELPLLSLFVVRDLGQMAV